MARRRRLSNPLALAVLVLLFERPMHPYEMAATLRERHKEESIKLNYGSLYTVIGLLLREGFIVPQATGREGRRPERTVYAITEAGRVELHDWMSDLVSTPAKEYPRFEAALSLLGVLPPDEAVALLEERVQRLSAETGRLRAEIEAGLQQGLERLFLIENEYRVALLDAERQWVAAFARALREETFPFVRQWRAWHATTPASIPADLGITAHQEAKEEPARSQ